MGSPPTQTLRQPLRQRAPLYALAILCGVAAVLLLMARSNVSRHIDTETDARDRIAAVESLRSTLLEAETGQRGYLLTDNPAYLEPFTRGTEGLDWTVAKVFTPTDRPDLAAVPSADETAVRALIDDKIAELRETIALHDAGRPDAALALVNTDRGKADMDQIDKHLDAMIALNVALGDTANAAKRRWRSLVSWTFIGILTLLATMLIWTFVNDARARRTALAERSLSLSEEARDRIEMLAQELDHRMKNLFAVMSAMIRQSARSGGPDVRAYAGDLDARLTSLGKAYYMTRELGTPKSMTSEQILDEVVRAQLLDSHALATSGQPVTVREEAVTPVALILHELTTNALKYGAWKTGAREHGSNDNATPTHTTPSVDVDWSLEGSDAVLKWSETAAYRDTDIDAIAASTRGYGSRLIDTCTRQLGGSFDRDWTDGGLTATLRVPLERLLAA